MSGDILAMQAQNALGAAKTAPAVSNINMRKARETAEDFEAFFLSQMLQPMFTDIDAEEPFGGGQAEEMWRTLQVDEMGKSFARQGGIGIADMVLQEMIKMQEVQ
jgi:Rod binding domain-containing protein